MSAILTADIHLNSHARDEYRWGLLEWFLAEQRADELLILGDLTDAKDRHDSRLVNRLHAAVMELRGVYRRIVILKGNHDYYDAEHPFFRFLEDRKHVAFVSDVAGADLSVGKVILVPAGADWLDLPVPDDAAYLLTHATFTGAKSENGTRMMGVDPALVRDLGVPCIAGDIHVPQRMVRGLIEYTGAPYHTRFGDTFDPRVMLLCDDGEREDLYFPAPRRTVLDVASPDDIPDAARRMGVGTGDYVRVRCHLRRTEYDRWRAYRDEVRAAVERLGAVPCGAEVVAVREGARAPRPEDQEVRQSDEDLVDDYARRKKAGAAHLAAGREILADA